MKKIINKLMLIFVSVLTMTLILLSFFSIRLKDSILKLAISESTNVASLVINQAVLDHLTTTNTNLLFEEARNEQSIFISVTTPALNLLNSLITTSAQKMLLEISSGQIARPDLFPSKYENGIIEQIPLGIAFNNPSLSWLGPTLPVRFKLIGDLSNSLVAKVNNYGINNVMIEVISEIKIKLMVLIPAVSQMTTLSFPITLALLLVQGEVPLYYQGSYDIKSGGLAIPLQ